MFLGSGCGAGGPSANRIADKVMDEPTNEHTTPGTFGKQVNDIAAAVLGPNGQVAMIKSEGGPIEEGGYKHFSIALVDKDTGPLPIANIDISTIVVTLYKSTGGAPFAAIASTPIFSVATGVIRSNYLYQVADWQNGDGYWLEVSGIKYTVGGVIGYLPVVSWTGQITELANVETKINSILNDTDVTLPAEHAALAAQNTAIEGKVDTVDTVVDSIKIDTGTTIPADIATLQADVDIIETHVKLNKSGMILATVDSTFTPSNNNIVIPSLAGFPDWSPIPLDGTFSDWFFVVVGEGISANKGVYRKITRYQTNGTFTFATNLPGNVQPNDVVLIIHPSIMGSYTIPSVSGGSESFALANTEYNIINLNLTEYLVNLTYIMKFNSGYIYKVHYYEDANSGTGDEIEIWEDIIDATAGDESAKYFINDLKKGRLTIECNNASGFVRYVRTIKYAYY